MEPITTAIIAALASLAEPAVKDAYHALKELVVKTLGMDHEVVRAVSSLEEKPDSEGRRATLNEELAASEAAKDPAIAAATQALLDQLKRLPGSQENVRQTVTGNRNIFSGTGDINIGGTPT